MDPTYGYYTVKLVGPPALLDMAGWFETTAKGFARDERDRNNLTFPAHDELARAMGYRSYDELPENVSALMPPDFAIERTVNQYRNPDGTQQYFVAVYEVSRSYAGPEEGGWWYDTGTLVQQTAVRSIEEAEQVAEQLREEYPFTRKRYSVLGGEDYDVRISLEPQPADFPDQIPHYE